MTSLEGKKTSPRRGRRRLDYPGCLQGGISLDLSRETLSLPSKAVCCSNMLKKLGPVRIKRNLQRTDLSYHKDSRSLPEEITFVLRSGEWVGISGFGWQGASTQSAVLSTGHSTVFSRK